MNLPIKHVLEHGCLPVRQPEYGLYCAVHDIWIHPVTMVKIDYNLQKDERKPSDI